MEYNTITMIFFLFFGLILGSFLNVCIHRIPLNKSIVVPSSSCPRCDKKIKFYDNIPLISYVILKGKCRDCGEPISLQYPIVELISGLFSLSLFSIYGLSFQYFILLTFLEALVVISFIDIHHKIIPDIISLPGIPIGLIMSIISRYLTWYDSLIGIFLGGGFLYLAAFIFNKLTGKEGMGGGDIKLLAMIGGWMGWKALPFIVLISSLTGSIIGVVALLFSRKRISARIPFGPFLSLGAVVYLFFGDCIIKFYFGLIM